MTKVERGREENNKRQRSEREGRNGENEEDREIGKSDDKREMH